MADTTGGYYTKTAYTKSVHTYFDPRRIASVQRANGHDAPDPGKPFVYVDFGCGYGLTVLLLAKLMPHAQFFGIDFIAEHIEQAKAYAESLGVGNVTYINASFGDVTPQMLPPVDFAVAHGILSWVDPDIRQQLRRAVGAVLKPGGTLTASYNLLPGWADFVPVRELLKDAVDRGADDATVIEGLRKMLYSDAKARGGQPPKMAQFLSELNLTYLRHELLGDYWHCHTNAGLAAEMARDGLQFAGPFQAPMGLRAVQDRTFAIEDPVYWEDFYATRRGESFRSATFVLGDGPAKGLRPALPQFGGYLTLAPDHQTEHKDYFTRGLFGSEPPFPSLPLSTIAGHATTPALQQQFSTAMQNTTVLFASRKFQPRDAVDGFALTDETADFVDRMNAIAPGDKGIALPGTGLLAVMPVQMWHMLAQCHNKPSSAYLREMKSAAAAWPYDTVAPERHVRDWQSGWAPWLAAQGAIRPL